MVELVRDRLKILQVGNIGTELNEASKNAYLNLSSKEMSSATDIGNLILKTRTFNGATIPNAGAIYDVTITDDSTTILIQPPVGQSWNISCIKIENLDPVNASQVIFGLTDGTSVLSLYSGAVNASTSKQWGLVSDVTGSFPAINLDVTNSMYVTIAQAGMSTDTQVTASYTKDVI